MIAIGTKDLIYSGRQGQESPQRASVFENVLEIKRETVDPDNTFLAKTLTQLGAIAWRSLDPAGAETRYREAVGIYRAANPASSATAVTVFLLARSVAKQDRCAEAVPLLRESLQRGEAVFSKEDWRLALVKQFLGRCLAKLGQNEEVEELLLAARAGLVAAHGRESEWAQKAVRDIVTFYTAEDRLQEAKRWRTPLAE